MILIKMAHTVSLASALILAALAASGCASGDTGSPAPAPTPSPNTDNSDGGSKADSASPASPGAGASCSSYYGAGGCCETLAGGAQAVVDACHQAKKVIDDGIAGGTTAASYEAACKMAIATAQQLGKCK